MFRIDRRLSPNEPAPQNSLNDEGIPAFDTLEPVIAWDDPLFVASECLISIQFTSAVDVHLALILKVCRQIQQHASSRVYTLQRYNCYFFAQTLIFCIACGASNWAGANNRLSKHDYDPSALAQGFPTLNSNAGIFGLGSPPSNTDKNTQYAKAHQSTASLIKQFRFKGILYSLSIPAELDQHASTIHGSINSVSYSYMRKIPGEILEVNDEQDMCNNLATNLRELLDQWWNENGTDVLLECCRQATARSIWDIEETSCRTHIYNPPIISLSCRLSTADPTIVYGDPPRLVRLDPSEYDLAGPKLLAGMRVTTGECDVHLIAFRLSPYDISWQASTIVRHPLSIGPAIILSCLDSFKQNMLIEINRRKIQGEYQDVEVQMVWDLENVPRYGRGKNSMFWWRKEKQPQEQEIMTTSTILEMQDYIGDLISAHGIRVEEYKWATKVTAAKVNRDIGRVLEEIWKGLVDQHL